MITFLSFLFLGCGDENTEMDDPQWFEASSYTKSVIMDSGYPKEIYLIISNTGSFSSVKFSYLNRVQVDTGVDSEEVVRRGECRITTAITPDEEMWNAECDEELGFRNVVVYSEGFKMILEIEGFSYQGQDLTFIQ